MDYKTGGCCDVASRAPQTGGCSDQKGGCSDGCAKRCKTDAPEVPPDAMPSRMKKALEAKAPPAGPAPVAAVTKKEAFKGGVSLGVCANALCLCAECECGKGCTCNVGDNSDTCEPCTDFRAAKAAKKQQDEAAANAPADVASMPSMS